MGNACGEVVKRVEKKANTVAQMMQTCERNLRNIVEMHDDLNRAADMIRADVEGGAARLMNQLDQREESMHAVIAELLRTKTSMLAEMADEVHEIKTQLQAGTDAGLKAVSEQEKYDFIINSPELENWVGTLAEMDITIKLADVGVSLNKTVHWDNVHRSLEGLRIGVVKDQAQPPAQLDSRNGVINQSHPERQPTQSLPALDGIPASPMSTSRSQGPSTPSSAVPNAVYVNGLPNNTTEDDLREVFSMCGEIKMVNARHIPSGGFSFVFFRDEVGAQQALDNPRVEINGKMCNVLAKKQVMA